MAMKPIFGQLSVSQLYCRPGLPLGVNNLAPRSGFIRKQSSNSAAQTSTAIPPSTSFGQSKSSLYQQHPLTILPLPNLLRSYLVATVSSSKILLPPCLSILSFLAHSRYPWLNPDHNTVLRWVLKQTFYSHFCGGETTRELQQTVTGLKEIGYKGVILAYAKEVVLGIDQVQDNEDVSVKQALSAWKEGTLKTVEMAEKGDFVALKFTGAGRLALDHLIDNSPMPPALENATIEICDLAVARGVRLAFDAEQQALQTGIDSWTLDFQKRYNPSASNKATVYGTYQAYLKSTPATLANHLAAAVEKDFTLGAKLVRGAYLASEPRNIIWSTKEETDQAYDGMIDSLIKRRYGTTMPSALGAGGNFPKVNLMVATHNQESVRKARKACTEAEDKDIEIVYAQLMGMADEVSCELLQAPALSDETEKAHIPQAYKYLVWGTTGECVKYLLRRAEENRHAMGRTKLDQRALGAEIFRRMGAAVGLAR
ncbi:MAG: hypothetical protein M1819_006584 [Sarea resinae]|nr:MAG: hypothetical protein M1819_006584 [Sarea resinae]